MNRTDIFRREVEDVLLNNILNWWLTMKDPRGGFYGEVASELTVLELEGLVRSLPGGIYRFVR